MSGIRSLTAKGNYDFVGRLGVLKFLGFLARGRKGYLYSCGLHGSAGIEKTHILVLEHDKGA
jgi:hypothetical protein